MDDFDQAPPPPEQQLTHEDLAKLAIGRVNALAHEALEHPNSTTMNELAENRPSWTTPINDESGHTVEELEVSWRGLRHDKQHPGGYRLTRYHTGSDRSLRSAYWISSRDDLLYKFSGAGATIEERDHPERCNPLETQEVMDEFKDIIEGALHPEKQASRQKMRELADASSPDGTKRRGGFLMRLARGARGVSRKVFDPSKIRPSIRS